MNTPLTLRLCDCLLQTLLITIVGLVHRTLVTQEHDNFCFHESCFAGFVILTFWIEAWFGGALPLKVCWGTNARDMSEFFCNYSMFLFPVEAENFNKIWSEQRNFLASLSARQWMTSPSLSHFRLKLRYFVSNLYFKNYNNSVS